MIIKQRFINKFLMSVNAESKMSTARESGGSLVLLDDAVRMVYSKEIEFKALPVMRFMQFATVKTELGIEPGLTISMLTYDNLKLGGVLKEGTRMTTQALSSSMKQITVGERGNAVAVSELLLQSSFDDIMASATNLLARDMAMVIDTELRDVALSGTNKVYGRKNDGGLVSARAEMEDKSLFSVAVIKDAVEVLATNNTPKIDNAFYICFVHPHQSRGLRDDPAWINASNYGAPTLLFSGEIGRIDDVRFIESTIMSNGVAPVGSEAYETFLKAGQAEAHATLDTYQAVLFGDNYYGLATSLPVELRDNGVIDFGREHGLAWYGIWGAGLLHDEYGVVIETV